MMNAEAEKIWHRLRASYVRHLKELYSGQAGVRPSAEAVGAALLVGMAEELADIRKLTGTS
jgi:hypothetical protein